MKIKLFEAFAGIGAQYQALKNLGYDVEHVGMCEWEVNAINSYGNLHYKEMTKEKELELKEKYSKIPKEEFDNIVTNAGYSSDGKNPIKTVLKKQNIYNALYYSDALNNYVDISKIKGMELDNLDIDLFTYSFPCQDLSLAGNGEGIKIGTRSGLLYEVERIIEEMTNKPKILLMENVKNLISKKHKEDFDIWLKKLEELGYVNHWQVMNAKDYGVPQNRERVFVVSILKDNGKFSEEYEFAKLIELKYNMKDFLETRDLNKFELSENRIPVSNYICDDLPTDFDVRELFVENAIMDSVKKGIESQNLVIRKLTPRECWRLMGFKDKEFDKVNGKVSNSQLYKQAGNSIVVDNLEYIFRNINEV